MKTTLKQPEDRPSVVREIGLFLGNLFVAFDDSAIRRSITLAQIAPNHRVLAIGYSPELMEALAKAAPHGLVEALDQPKVIERARKRHLDAIAGGRFDVVEGGVESIPFARGFFDRVLAIEQFESWPEPSTAFGEVLRVLQPDGILVLALRQLEKGQIKRQASKLNEIAKAPNRDEALLEHLRDVGFIRASIEQERYAVARKPLNFG